MIFRKIFDLCTLSAAMIVFVMISSPVHALAQDYHLGHGDVITLTILASGREEQKIDLTVSDSGQINVPLIGFVKVEGLTIQQLEDRIYKPLAADYYVDPQVNIQIKDYNSLHYYISGAVKNPGLYIMSSNATLMELIAKAGGVTEDCGNVGYILRNPKGGSQAKVVEPAAHDQIAVDLRNLLDKGSTSHNVVLEPGDVVYFPSKRTRDVAESKIYIDGEVDKPGVYDYQEGLTALSACITAGGFKQFAAPNRTTIIRQNNDKVEVIKINLSDVQKGTTPDVVLKPGDHIHVPETWL
jgi:polysaccharide export outer membrane protein